MKSTLQSLNENILALKELFESIKEERIADKAILSSYNGFGNIKEILMDPFVDENWSEKQAPLQSKIKDLFNLIDSHFVSYKESSRIIENLRSSVLTAFYTPNEVIRSIIEPIIEQNDIKTILEPSAGIGAFCNYFSNKGKFEVTAIEKDFLSSLILEKSYQNEKNIITGRIPFEEFSNQTRKKYDLIISNIPFGSISVYDSKYSSLSPNDHRKKSTSKIHNYFFAKSIDLLSEKGKIAFITSTGVADSINNSFIREYLVLNCEMKAGIRLPNNVFTESGTKVNTDVLIFEKRNIPLNDINGAKGLSKDFLNLEEALFYSNNGKSNKQHINKLFYSEDSITNLVIGDKQIDYFNNKEQIVITSNKSVADISNDLKSKLIDFLKSEPDLIIDTKNKELSSIPISKTGQLSFFDMLFDDENNKQNLLIKEDVLKEIPLNETLLRENLLIEGNVFVYDNRVGKVKFNSNGPVLELLSQEYNLDKFHSSSKTLTLYKQLLDEDFNNSGSSRSDSIRLELNREYDNFISKYGAFNTPGNQDIKTLDIEGFKLFGLELYNGKNFEKSDIFSKSIYESEVVENLDLKSAIDKSLNEYGNIKIEYVSKLLNITNDDVISEGLKKEYIFINPETDKNFSFNHPDKNYFSFINKDHFSFNYVTKDELLSGPVRFKIIELEEKSNHPKASKYKDDIQKSLSYLKSVDNKYLNINEIDVQLGENWIPLDVIKDFSNELFGTDVKLVKSISGQYKVETRNFSYVDEKELAVRCKNGRTLKGSKLLEEALHGTFPKITYSEGEKENKRTYIDREAMSNAQMKIEQINQKWRDYLNKRNDVSYKLELIYNNTQNLEVERIYDGSHLELKGLKNFEAMKHQKNGVWQSIVQNGGLIDHGVGSGKTLLISCLAMELKRLKIAKKVLIIGMKANTMQIYNHFKLSYPNAKILAPTDSDFTPGNRAQFFQRVVNNNWDAVIMTHEQFQNIPQSREIQIQVLEEEVRNLRLDLDSFTRYTGSQKNNRLLKGLQVRIENKSNRIFELSESIKRDSNLLSFEKMGFEHLIVDESQQFKNLEYSTRFDRVAGLGDPEGSQRALNLLFAVRTLQNHHKGDKGVTFCSGTTISNSLIELYLLKKYLVPTELEKRSMPNFDSWARTYAKLSRDYELSVTNEVKPKERFRSFLKVPELARFYRSFTNVANDNNLKIDKPELENIFVEINATKTQELFMNEIIKAVKSDDFSFFNMNLTESQLNARMLIATSLATKVSLDVRLIDPTLDVTDGSKVIEVTNNLSRIYNESNDYKGTQFVFLDSSTPTSKNAKEFNIYQSLKDELVRNHGIPENEIQFIHDFKTKKSREKLFDDVNSGKVRIVLGSTEKMGVGVNMQRLCVAMHQYDIPWTPKDIEQRLGRGARQGNIAAKKYLNNKIPCFTYGTTKTLDAYKYYIVDIKQRFINQIKQDNISYRTIDEGDMDSDGTMSAAAFIARLSGKEELLEKNKVDKRLSDLEMKKNILKKEHQRCLISIQNNKETIDKINHTSELYLVDLNESKNLFSFDQKDVLKYNLDFENNKTDDPALIKTRINMVSNQFIIENKPVDSFEKIGSVGNFDFRISKNGWISEVEYKLEMTSNKTGLKYSFGNSEYNSVSNRLTRFPYDALKGIDVKIEEQKKWKVKLENEILNDTELIKKIDFNIYDEEINELRFKSKELELIIEKSDTELQENSVIKIVDDIVLGIKNNSKISDHVKALVELIDSGIEISKKEIDYVLTLKADDNVKIMLLSRLNIPNAEQFYIEHLKQDRMKNGLNL